MTRNHQGSPQSSLAQRPPLPFDPEKGVPHLCLIPKLLSATLGSRIMRRGRVICGVVMALSLVVSLDNLLPHSPVDMKRVGNLTKRQSNSAPLSSPVDLRRNGELLIAGRALRCGRVRNVLDPGMPSLGLAAAGVVVFNPYLLNNEPDAVRLFVFHHECGHHNVGSNEIGADCWAVKQGVSQGWFDHKAIEQVCDSFGDAPASTTHPSGARRCASLRQCFANVTASGARQKSATKRLAKW
jgi:hypothetical protein